MFQVTAHNGTDNSKIDLSGHQDRDEAILSAEAAYLVGNFDGAVVIDLDRCRQVFSVGVNT